MIAKAANTQCVLYRRDPTGTTTQTSFTLGRGDAFTGDIISGSTYRLVSNTGILVMQVSYFLFRYFLYSYFLYSYFLSNYFLFERSLLLCAKLSHIFCPLFIKFYRLYYCLQITKSQERGSNIHDPSMITVPPVEQYTNRYIFNAPYFSGGNSQLQVCRVFTCRESTELTFYIYIRIVFSTLVYPATCL